MTILYLIVGAVVGAMLGVFFMGCFYLTQKYDFEREIERLTEENHKLLSDNAWLTDSSLMKISCFRDEE